jgi:hypothetical protein
MTGKGPVARWLEKKYIQWINEQGEMRTQEEFANFLGVDRVTFNRHYNGTIKRMELSTALKYAKKLNDYEILDILGYERPNEEKLLEGFPPEFKTAFSAALNEARSELVKRGITEGTEEARSIINTAFERYGLNLTFIEPQST